ncbi:MAG: hypothetical protein B6240_05430 [Desulfobacteraceae bacterium 4572_87]|nr:MAG: hypothetical protein B6240_05430 [Desulfobacteraceae bacterium 4572_87]
MRCWIGKRIGSLDSREFVMFGLYPEGMWAYSRWLKPPAIRLYPSGVVFTLNRDEPKNPDSEASLSRWFKAMRNSEFSNFSDLRSARL